MKPQKQGLTLVEVLIALFIFSFASLYISRTVNHLLKRQKKNGNTYKRSKKPLKYFGNTEAGFTGGLDSP